ncbi:MAG: hypothetical protein OEV92_12260, partial [Nitrospinota bacterium]|nr:hypothetical protein [Nitrospinota bacterium]
MSFHKVKPIIAHILHAVMFIYAAVLLAYAIHGPFDYTILGIHVYLTNGLKPYQFFMFALILRAILFLLPDEGYSTVYAAAGRWYSYLAGEGRALPALILIFVFSMALRMWSLLNGAQDGVFYDDAWHFMPAIKAFFFGNYLYDNGYP